MCVCVWAGGSKLYYLYKEYSLIPIDMITTRNLTKHVNFFHIKMDKEKIRFLYNVSGAHAKSRCFQGCYHYTTTTFGRIYSFCTTISEDFGVEEDTSS